jgi:hypothetical protein
VRKKRKLIITAVIAAIAIAEIVYLLVMPLMEYTIPKSALVEHSRELMEEWDGGESAALVVLDSNFSNRHAVYLFSVRYEDGREEYRAVSYTAHLVFPRYELCDWGQMSDEGEGYVEADGFPRKVTYDFSDLTLVEVSSEHSYGLKWVISGVINVLVLLAVFVTGWVLWRREERVAY